MTTINRSWQWSEEAKRRISISKIGKLRGNYKVNIGYYGLHDRIRRHLQKPDRCQECHKNKKLELANISGQYFEDLNDWVYICHQCNISHDMQIMR